MVRLKEDEETLVVRIDPSELDFLLASNPSVFFITEHYRGYPYMLIRLSLVSYEDIEERIEVAWRQTAPPKLIAAYDKRGQD